MGTDGIDGNSVFAGAITENAKVDLEHNERVSKK